MWFAWASLWFQSEHFPWCAHGVCCSRSFPCKTIITTQYTDSLLYIRWFCVAAAFVVVFLARFHKWKDSLMLIYSLPFYSNSFLSWVLRLIHQRKISIETVKRLTCWFKDAFHRVLDEKFSTIYTIFVSFVDVARCLCSNATIITVGSERSAKTSAMLNGHYSNQKHGTAPPMANQVGSCAALAQLRASMVTWGLIVLLCTTI